MGYDRTKSTHPLAVAAEMQRDHQVSSGHTLAMDQRHTNGELLEAALNRLDPDRHRWPWRTVRPHGDWQESFAEAVAFLMAEWDRRVGSPSLRGPSPDVVITDDLAQAALFQPAAQPGEDRNRIWETRDGKRWVWDSHLMVWVWADQPATAGAQITRAWQDIAADQVGRPDTEEAQR